MSLADIITPINLSFLVILVIIFVVLLVVIISVMNTILYQLAKLEHLIAGFIVNQHIAVPKKAYAQINYPTDYIPVFPCATFDLTLANFICCLLMSTVNMILDEPSYLPDYMKKVYEIKSNGPIGYIFQVDNSNLYIISIVGNLGVVDTIMEVSGVQTVFSDIHNRPYPEALVSMTINQTYHEIRESIAMFLSSLSSPNIIVTGYAFGAGVATLLSAALSMSYNIAYDGIATPRVGNNSFYSLFSKHITNYWDVINTTDLYTMYPLSDPVFLFSNSNHIYNINIGTSTPTGNHSLTSYLCGVSSGCNSGVKWNTQMFSGNDSID